MQCSLVGYRARQDRIAVLVQGDGRALEPLGPLLAQMAPKPEFVDRRPIWIGFKSYLVWQCLCWLRLARQLWLRIQVARKIAATRSCRIDTKVLLGVLLQQLLQQPQCAGLRYRLGAPLYAKLLEYPAVVALDRVQRQMQSPGNLAVREALRDEL